MDTNNKNNRDKIKEMRAKTGLSQNKFATLLQIPASNIQKWEQGVTSPPEYVIGLIERNLRYMGAFILREENIKDKGE